MDAGNGKLKISIILPLFDRRTAGWQALVSALDQDADRKSYEIIVVVGRGFDDEAREDARVPGLLEACDVVIRIDADPRFPENEIVFCIAGCQHATGDLLFFMEGHTVLQRDCCSLILEYFSRNPGSSIAWAPRVNHQESALGNLIGLNNQRHEQLAQARGDFSLGGNSVISKALFDQVDALDTRYGRFGETALLNCVLERDIPIGKLSRSLCTHHNDMSMQRLVDLTLSMGVARYGYFNAAPARHSGPAGLKRKIFEAANRVPIAKLLHPAARAAGLSLLRLAEIVFPTRPGLAFGLYVSGLRLTVLCGFCAARIGLVPRPATASPAP